jgi:hypothetical protein
MKDILSYEEVKKEEPTTSSDTSPIYFSNGVYSNLEEDIYHSLKAEDYISSSFLKKFAENPRLAFLENYPVDGFVVSKEETESMRLGSLIHTMILEPDKFNCIEFCEKGQTRTKDNKHKERYSHGVMINNIQYVFDNDKRYDSLKKVLELSKKEVSIFINNKKCRIDAMFVKENILCILDLKTTSNDLVGEVPNSLSYKLDKEANGGHALQLQWYKMLVEEIIEESKKSNIANDTGIDFSKIEKITCVLVYVSTKEPHDILYYPLEQNILNIKKHEIEDSLKRLDEQKEKHKDGTMWDTTTPFIFDF